MVNLKICEQNFCHIRQQFLKGVYIPEFKHRIRIMLIEFWEVWFPLKLVINFPFDIVWSSTVIKSLKEYGHCHYWWQHSRWDIGASLCLPVVNYLKPLSLWRPVHGYGAITCNVELPCWKPFYYLSRYAFYWGHKVSPCHLKINNFISSGTAKNITGLPGVLSKKCQFDQYCESWKLYKNKAKQDKAHLPHEKKKLKFQEQFSWDKHFHMCKFTV